MAQTEDVRAFVKGMNKDIDPRLLPSGVYIDALNINIRDSINGISGAVTNLMESEVRSDSSLFRYTYGQIIIGMFSSESDDAVYIFIADTTTNQNHRIIRYDTISNSHSVVVCSNHLPWSSTTVIKSFDYVDGMLFWTDGESEPMTFNSNIDYLTLVGINDYALSIDHSTAGTLVHYNNIVYERSAAGNPTLPPSGDFSDNADWNVHAQDDLTEDYFTIAKKVPIYPPDVFTFTEDSFKTNYITGRFFQFKYRFVYAGNEKTVFSPVSRVVFSENDYLSPELFSDTPVYNNAISIQCPVSGINKLVKKVEIVARQGNFGIWRLISSIDIEDASNDIIGFSFLNEGLYQALASIESDQIYSDVPRVAGTQKYANNRLVFGDCTTGFDKDFEIDLKTQVIIERSIGGSALYSVDTSTSINSNPIRYEEPLESAANLETLFNDMNYIPSVGDKISVEGQTSVVGNVPIGKGEVTVLAGWDIEDIYNALISLRFKIGDGSTVIFRSGVTEYIYDNTTGEELGSVRHENTHYLIEVQEESIVNTFKSGSWINIGMQYFDEYGRTNGVLWDESNSVYIPTFGERGLSPGDTVNTGASSILISINHDAPSWAKYYSICYQKASYASKVIGLTVVEATSTVGVASPTKLPSGAVRINLGSYNDFNERNGQSSNLSYDFEKGDRIRFITKGVAGIRANANDWVDAVYDYAIINVGSDWLLNTTGTSSDPADSDLWIDAFIPSSDINSAEMEDAIIEVYRQSKEVNAEEALFYESDKIFLVNNGKHEGDVNQVEIGTSYSFEFAYIGGDSIVNLRLKDTVGVPKRYDITTGDGFMTFSNVVIDETLRPIWQPYTAYSSSTPDRVQYESKTYVCISDVFAGESTPPDLSSKWSLEYNFIAPMQIMSVQLKNNDYYEVELVAISGTLWTSTPPLSSVDITFDSIDEAQVILENGDAYLRTRQLLLNGSVVDVNVEDYSISDFYESQYASIGRASAIINQQESNRYATLMYTEPFIPNTDINNLNNVYPDVNFEEYNRNFGKIIHLADKGDRLIMFQEDKISMVMLDRSVTYDGQGQSTYLGTNDIVLSKAIPMPGEYGINDYRSVVSSKSTLYFADVQRGSFCRLNGNSIEEISKLGIHGWTSQKMKSIIDAGNDLVVSMYDPANGLIVFYVNEDQEGVVFSEEDNAWISRNTMYRPNFSAYINNKSFYAKNEAFYEINQAGLRNHVDGGTVVSNENYNSSIKFPSNIEPNVLKNYLSLSIDETYPTAVSLITKSIFGGNNQETAMNIDDHVMREQVFHLPVLRDINTPGVTYPIISGDTMKGMHSEIELTLNDETYRNNIWILRSVSVIISKG